MKPPTPHSTSTPARNFRGAQYTEFAHPPEPTPKRCLAQGVGTLSQLPSNPKLLFFLENLGRKHYQPLAHHTEVFTQRSWLYFNPGIITLLPTTVISCKASHYSSLLTPFPAAPRHLKEKAAVFLQGLGHMPVLVNLIPCIGTRVFLGDWAASCCGGHRFKSSWSLLIRPRVSFGDGEWTRKYFPHFLFFASMMSHWER